MILGSSPLTRGKQAASCGCCVAARLIPTHAGKTLPNHDQTGVSKPHPRSRGENSVYGIAITAMSGSSPLTRGKRRDRRNHILTVGLIPAHAGKTLEDRRSRAQALAHPRSRGENLGAVIGWPRKVGSSPLTRGKRCLRAVRGLLLGLIPTHAGKTIGVSHPPGTRAAHPRSRGENRRW